MKTNELVEQYPWLAKVNTVEDYLPPEYYQHLLKPYTFDGVSDLSLLEKFLYNKKPSKVLELGCGSGRASRTVVSIIPTADYTFSDLSERMLEAAKQHLPAESSFVISDAIEYMENAKDQYDLVYTLWSFSHSTHQHIHRLGIKKAEDYISSVTKKFVWENIVKDGSFFLIHFDSLSQEQSILMRQWKRVFLAFANIEEQSPSKQIIDKTLLELDTKGEIVLSMNHLQGDAIHYESEDEVLETFMNFHLETYFNNLPLTKSVINDIKGQISKYRNDDGSYDIIPGCYIYSFIKN
ncbi:MAG: Trans-aconitate 2-methyltransferase [candidate division WS2 bacterium]|nr:Trans-aconitate 2-methyltransferase [Candidatus Psychracetigena formicireducens]